MLLRASTPAQPNYGINVLQIRHVVTPQMEVETAAMANRMPGPEQAISNSGKSVQFGEAAASRPEFVLFIKTGCPCSVDAQPIFNNLARKFAKEVDFVGVIDGDPEVAKSYASQFLVAFPVVADQHLSIIRSYRALAATFSALVARNGHIVKMWPGYSVSILKEMNHDLSRAADVKETPFDPEYAPIQKASGCAFGL
jgi:hypothetical protein